MLLLKLGSEMPNLFKNIQSALNIQIKCRLNFHEVECTGNNFTNPCQFSLENSEMVKAVTLAFCSTQQHFIRDIIHKFDIPNLPLSPDTGQNSDRGISDFQISSQPFIEENRHNSRTSNDSDVKLGPVTKLEKKEHGNIKKVFRRRYIRICDIIIIFRIYGQLGAIWKSDSGHVVCKTYIFIKSNLLFYKN